MRHIKLKLEPLTKQAFATYGDVIEVSDKNEILAINYGLTQRHHELARVDVNDNDSQAIISIFRSKAITLPFRLEVLERHPLGSQAFIGINRADHAELKTNIKAMPGAYIVVVAEAGELDFSALRAFLAEPHQGVNYHKGTWHHYCLSLDIDSDFLVVDRRGEGNNCDEVQVPTDISITLEY